MKYINSGGSLSSKYTIIPPLSNAGSTIGVLPINLEMIEVGGKWYYLALIMDANFTDIDLASALGILAVERLSDNTFGTPFWVYSTSGSTPTPQTGFTQYNFNEPISTSIKAEIQNERYQILAYPNDDTNGFDGMLTDGSGDKFEELSAITIRDNFIRISRSFEFGTALSRIYIDFGDGIPVVTNLPSSPQKAVIRELNDGRVGIMCGSTSGRLEIYFAISDIDTLNFRAENIYKIVYGEATGQLFPGAYKNGVWAYPDFLHDATDNKIKMVCSKYKEGIFYFDFDYSDVQP